MYADDPYATNADNNTIWRNSQGGFGEFPPRKTTKLFRRFLCNLANHGIHSTMQKKRSNSASFQENAVGFCTLNCARFSA